MTADTTQLNGDDDARFEAELERRRRSFDAWAIDYDRYRPSYPDALFERVAERLHLGTAPTVADLGAGTGKASRAMARRGWLVSAVEPGGPMLDILVARALAEGLPIDAHLASAEETGLPDASVDLVTAAQSFHWFDTSRAVPEMARIVRPGGGVAAFWNDDPEEETPFDKAYHGLLAKYVPERHLNESSEEDEARTRRQLADGGWFDIDERATVRHVVEMTHADFIGLTFTSSQVRMFAVGEAEQRLRSELEDLLLSQLPGGVVSVPYSTKVFIGRRTSR